MKIIALKLITGEEILGELETEDEKQLTLNNPVGIAVVRGKDGQPNVGFAPFPLHAEQVPDQKLALDKSHVIYSYVPAEDFVNNYKQVFGIGLIIPPKQQIITG
jgi:hypothetical protein